MIGVASCRYPKSFSVNRSDVAAWAAMNAAAYSAAVAESTTVDIINDVLIYY